jgi:hypothetical protein
MNQTVRIDPNKDEQARKFIDGVDFWFSGLCTYMKDNLSEVENMNITFSPVHINAYEVFSSVSYENECEIVIKIKMKGKTKNG